jgi:hypothetical protein
MAIDDVSDLSRRVQYTSGAGQTTFTYPFRIFDEGDLDVYVGDVQYTLGTMYSVTGVDNDLGGSVIFTTGLSAGAIVTIYSDTAIDRDTDYQQNGPWTSARLNSELDKFMVISQELRAKISRAIRGSILGNTVAEMPSAADRASKYLWFNASGDPTVVTGDAAQPLTHSVYLVYPTNGQTVITVPAAYTPSSYDLSVYLNGVKQVVGVDYAETSITSITLTTPATSGDVIEFSIGEVFDVTLVRTGREEQSFTGLTTPTITLTTASYTPGAHEVDVFFNGALLATADYTETNSTTITLGFTPVASDQFRVIVGRAVNVTNVSRSQVGAALYPQTAAEIAAGVTPTDYGYAPGDVRRYGADLTGATDARTAIQNAIASNEVITFPDGDYLITGASSADAYLNGVVVPYTSQDSVTGNKTFKGSRSVRLLCGSNNMVLWRHSASNCRIEGGLILDVNGHTGCIGLGVMPEDNTQTTTVVHQNWNSFEFIWIKGAFDEGIYMQAGPDVAAADSGCWYNDFTSVHVQGAIRGLYMAQPTNAGGSGVNRNNFFGCRFGQASMNTGIQITNSCATNKFYACNMEGIVTGTAPNATPTALVIQGVLAESNQFFGCTAENCTRDVENENNQTELYGCTFIGTSVWTELPLISVGGYSASGVPQRIQGLSYILNGQWPGLVNGFVEVDAFYGMRVPTSKTLWLSAQEETSSSGGSASTFTFAADYNTHGPSMYLVTRGGNNAAGTSYAHRASIFFETSSGTFVEGTQIVNATDGTSVFATDTVARSSGNITVTVSVTRAATTFVNYAKITRLT